MAGMSASDSCMSGEDFPEGSADGRYEILYQQTHQSLEVRKDTLMKLRKGKGPKKGRSHHGSQEDNSRHPEFSDPDPEVRVHRLNRNRTRDAHSDLNLASERDECAEKSAKTSPPLFSEIEAVQTENEASIGGSKNIQSHQVLDEGNNTASPDANETVSSVRPSKLLSITSILEGLSSPGHSFYLDENIKRNFSIQEQYDANETTRNLLHWRGTVLQFIFWKPITWMCVMLHYAGFFWTRYLRSSCAVEFKPSDCWYDRWALQHGLLITDVPVFMTLAAFLFVSYNNMCLRIFERQYFTCEMITGRITSMAMHTRAVVDDPARRWGLQRLILVAHCIYYWNHRRAAAENHGHRPGSPEHPGTWEQLSVRFLIPEDMLSKAECEHVGRFRGNRCVLVMGWYEAALRRLRAGGDAEPRCALVDGPDRRKFLELMMGHVLEVKMLFASTSMVAQFAVPFSYYHLTFLVLLLNLVLLAYCFLFMNGLRGNPASLVVYPAVVIMLSGLHELANKMSDPFGDDPSDLNLDAFREVAVRESRQLCFAPGPPEEPGQDPFWAVGDRARAQWRAKNAAAAAADSESEQPAAAAPASGPAAADAPGRGAAAAAAAAADGGATLV